MKYTRRHFIGTTAAGVGLMLSNPLANAEVTAAKKYDPYEIVNLGKTSIRTSRLAMGTGIRGGRQQSNLTRMGFEAGVQLVRQIYQKGVRMFDSADSYGTHAILSEALKIYPRKDYAIFTKFWFAGEKERNVDVFVNRFLKELQMDYIDCVSLHCAMTGTWNTEQSDFMEGLDRLKQKGVIRAHGISCHSLDALQTAAKEPWVDICYPRINPSGERMDDTFDKVWPVVLQLHQSGKGVVAMKVYGEGTFADNSEQKNNSLKFLLQSGAIDVLDIGMDKMSDLNDTEERIKQIDQV